MKLTPMKAIRLKCLDCCCGSSNEVRLCTCVKCPLYPYRLGQRPKEAQELKAMEFIENSLEKPMTEAQIEASKRNAERLRKKDRR